MSFELWSNYYTSIVREEAKVVQGFCSRYQESALAYYEDVHDKPMGPSLAGLNQAAYGRYQKKLDPFDRCFTRQMDALKRISDLAESYITTVKSSFKADKTFPLSRYDICKDYRSFITLELSRNIEFVNEHQECLEDKAYMAHSDTATFALDYFMTFEDKTAEELDTPIDFAEVSEFQGQSRTFILEPLVNVIKYTPTGQEFIRLQDKMFAEGVYRRKDYPPEYAELISRYENLHQLVSVLGEKVKEGFKKIPQEGTRLSDVYTHLISPMRQAFKSVLQERVSEMR